MGGLMQYEPLGQFGPNYPRELGTVVAKYRFKARGGLVDLTYADRYAYGDAVLKAIRAKATSLSHMVEAKRRIHCASRTDHQTGENILAAVNKQNYTALLTGHKQRTWHEQRELYYDAMVAKHGVTRAQQIVDAL